LLEPLEGKICNAERTFSRVGCYDTHQITSHGADDNQNSTRQRLSDLTMPYFSTFDGVIEVKRIVVIGLFCLVRCHIVLCDVSDVKFVPIQSS
jgi:hypothetical protein